MAKKSKLKIKKPSRSRDNYFNYDIDDTIKGIDKDQGEAYRKAKKGIKPRKA